MAASPERLEAALDVALDALRLIAGDRCETYTSGRCSDKHSGRERGARSGADAWCDACVAHDALTCVVDGTVPAPSWEAIVTTQRDEAVAHAEALNAAARRMWESWSTLRRGAEAVLAVPQDNVDDVRRLAGGAA